ncbi:MAG: M15 family metallopeptidase [Alphaproteobacteria bacterium]|nr:M15 family metallopeptidase [Alphaproteobacteria bacterium]
MFPKGFIYLHTIDPTIIQEIRYAGSDNFLGRPVRGYLAPLCITQEKIAQSLQKVQQKLLQNNQSLVVFDAYRPQDAVNHFVEWAEDVSDQVQKNAYYPQIDKRDVFKLGFIAKKSQHSRGCAVDLTIATLHKDGSYALLDMGTPFDFFDDSSHTMNPNISASATQNRALLKGLMEEAGFQNYSKEWWHYSYPDELYPDTYFNFPVTHPDEVFEAKAVNSI